MIRWKPKTENMPERQAICRECRKPLIRAANVGDMCPKCRQKVVHSRKG